MMDVTSGRSLDAVMRDVAVGSLATCLAACVVLAILYLYGKVQRA